MERTKLLTVAVIGLLLLNMATIGFLVLRPGKPGSLRIGGLPGGEGPARIIIERLRFDPQQQERFQELVEAHRKQMRELTTESVTLVQTYYRLLEADQTDAQLADSLSQQIAQNQRKQVQLNFAHFGEIKALCKPDQQADFKQLVTELSSLFGHQQRPSRRQHNNPPLEQPTDRPGPGLGGELDGRPDGPPPNLPPRP